MRCGRAGALSWAAGELVGFDAALPARSRDGAAAIIRFQIGLPSASASLDFSAVIFIVPKKPVR